MSAPTVTRKVDALAIEHHVQELAGLFSLLAVVTEQMIADSHLCEREQTSLTHGLFLASRAALDHRDAIIALAFGKEEE